MANERREPVSLPRMPGRVMPAGGINQVSARGLADAASQSSGAEQLFSKAANLFGQAATAVGRIADQAAAREGQEAGAMAGLDPEFRVRGDQTIYSQHFNQAGLETFKSKAAVDLQAQMEAVAEKYPADPEKLTAALQSVRKGWFGGLNKDLAPHVLPDMDSLFNRHQIGLVRQAKRQFHENVRAEQLGALEADREMRARTAEQQAYRLGLDETADQVLAGELADLKARLSVRGPDGQFVMTPQEQQRVLRTTEVGMARARISGAFARLPDLGSRQRFIDDLGKRYQAGGDKVLDLFDPAEFHALEATLLSEARREGLGHEQATRVLKEDIRAFRDAAKDGLALKDDEMAGLKARVAGTNNPELIDAFHAGLDDLALVRHLNTLAPSDIEAAIASEEQRVRAEGASITARDTDRLDLMRGYLDKAKTAIATNQLGFAAKTGVVTLPPLEWGNPASLRQRVAASEQAAAVLKREPQYFQPQERDDLAAISRQGGDQMLAVAGAVVSGFGNHSPKAIAEITKEAPVLSVVGNLWRQTGASEPPQIARDVAKGVELRGLKGFKTMVDAAFVPMAVNDTIGDAFLDRPEYRAAIIDAANAAYDALAYRKQFATFEPNEYQAVLRQVVGEREIGGVTYGGVVTPSDGWFKSAPSIQLPPVIRQDAWRDVVGMVDLGDLDRAGIPRPAGVDQNPILMDRIRNGTLVEKAPGKYAVALGAWDQPGAEEYALGADGKPFILDLEALAPVLARRRPDLFAGR